MLSLLLVPGAGIEPARIAPLVFETSASTDSAIRAGVNSFKKCKGIVIFRICKIIQGGVDTPWSLFADNSPEVS